MISRSLFAQLVGLLIVSAHVLITFLFIFWWDLPDGANFQDVTLPITAAYVVSIVIWFFENEARRATHPAPRPYSPALMLLVAIVVGAMIVGLFAVPISYSQTVDPDIEALNTTYVTIEVAFGGMFGVIMSRIFGHEN